MKDIISKDEYERKLLKIKCEGLLPENIIRKHLNAYFIVESDKEIREREISNKISQIMFHIEKANRNLKEMLNYPYDLSELNQNAINNTINSNEITNLNKLVQELDLRYSGNDSKTVYQKCEPQTNKRNIATRVNVGANPTLDIVTKRCKRYTCLNNVPIFI